MYERGGQACLNHSLTPMIDVECTSPLKQVYENGYRLECWNEGISYPIPPREKLIECLSYHHDRDELNKCTRSMGCVVLTLSLKTSKSYEVGGREVWEPTPPMCPSLEVSSLYQHLE